jgi:hypothetical protein
MPPSESGGSGGTRLTLSKRFAHSKKSLPVRLKGHPRTVAHERVLSPVVAPGYFKKDDNRMTLTRIRRTRPTIETRERRQKNVPGRRDGPVPGGRGLW